MELFHVLNRGVDKRTIFQDDKDRFRFVHDLFEFNDQNIVNTTSYYFNQSYDIASRKIERKPRKLLVDIHAFCLMRNHYHLLLSSKVEKGIPQFMKKLNMGYAKYFNGKYKRTGALFEGRYKSIFIEKESHFLHLPYYIHLNPLDYYDPDWRDNKIKDYKKTLSYLKNYRWSSLLDYMGRANFPSLIQKDFLSEVIGKPENYEKSLVGWLKDRDNSDLSDISLE